MCDIAQKCANTLSKMHKCKALCLTISHTYDILNMDNCMYNALNMHRKQRKHYILQTI